jgi:hypothetical protein
MMTRRQAALACATALAGLGAEKKTNGGADVQIRRLPEGAIQPQLALVYYTGDAHKGDLAYVRSTDFGQSFSTPLMVNSQEGSAIAMGAIRGAQISVVKRNRVHVAWNGSDTAQPRGPMNPEAGKPGSPMLYARLNDRGTAFEPQRNLMHETFGLDGGGSIAADHNGNVYVGWHGKAQGARPVKWAARSGLRVRATKAVRSGKSGQYPRSRPAPVDVAVCGSSPIPAA